MQKKKNKLVPLLTEAGEKLVGTPWNVYPRPQMKRGKWLCLNGEWDFETESGKTKILVPFCPESVLSGYAGNIRYGEKLKYTRTFSVPDDWRGRVILHFGAVSRECEVKVNGTAVCTQDNAYLPFSADVTSALKDGENTLQVTAINDLSPDFPYGKQKKKRGGMWYTPVSGIWQTVWLEPVPENYIKSIKIACDARGADIALDGATDGVAICDGDEYTIENGRARIEPREPKLWSPEEPHLYEFTVRCGKDEISSYFALRTLTTETVGGVPRLCLNGKPYFMNGLLDQGYYSDGLYTPASPTIFENDILKMKSLGFNTLRKHIKIEPEQFYYDCDRLGMIVFQDMVNGGKYSFLRDTILPTMSFTKLSDKRRHKNAAYRRNFIAAAEETVKTLQNHPSIALWTIFNEGWGQFCADEMYERIKSLDGTRFVDSTSGWFRQKKTDVDSLHIYFKRLRLGKRRELPQLISEFGGYVYKVDEHSANVNKTYGYKIFTSRERYVAAMRELYIGEVLPLTREGLSGAILTQLSDVEDETNGILTYDRKVMKITPRDDFDLLQIIQSAEAEK